MIFPTLIAAFVALSVVQTPPSEEGSAAVIELAEVPALVEYFLVSAPAGESESVVGSTGGGVEGEPIAAVAMRVIEREGPGGEFLYEREIVFAEGGLRIRHTETGDGWARRLVWREFLPSGSRTWVADWTAGERGGQVRSIAYGWNRPVHEAVMSQMELDRPVFGPLEVLHGMRTGRLACGDAGGVIGVIDPTSAGIIDAQRTTIPIGSEFIVDLRRPDGTLLLGVDFDVHTDALTSLRLSDRAATTRPIERAEFDRLNRRWKVESRRPYDAMLALIPTRR